MVIVNAKCPSGFWGWKIGLFFVALLLAILVAALNFALFVDGGWLRL